MNLKKREQVTDPRSHIQRRAAGGAEVHVNVVARLAAPLAAIAATIAVRKVLDSRYRRMSDRPVPDPKDMRVTFVRTLLWSTATAVIATAVHVAVVRGIQKSGSKVVAE